MKTAKAWSFCVGLLGAVLLIAAVLLSFAAQNAPTRLLWVSADAQQRTQDYMDTLCRMDLESLRDMTAGKPEYKAEGEFDSQLAEFLWETYTENISYEFSGECYGSDSGILRDVKVTVLDISSVLQKLKESSYDLLAQRAAEMDGDYVFDEAGMYREEFAMNVLREGAEKILQEGIISKSVDLTLEMVFVDGRWFVLPNQAVTNILTGSIGK